MQEKNSQRMHVAIMQAGLMLRALPQNGARPYTCVFRSRWGTASRSCDFRAPYACAMGASSVGVDPYKNKRTCWSARSWMIALRFA